MTKNRISAGARNLIKKYTGREISPDAAFDDDVEALLEFFAAVENIAEQWDASGQRDSPAGLDGGILDSPKSSL